MNRRIFIHTAVSLVLIFFLFTPALLRAFHETSGLLVTHTTMSKSSASPSKVDSQFLFEEKEREEKGSEQLAILPFMYEIPSVSCSYTEERILHRVEVHNILNTHIPIYLTKRALLI